MCGSSSSGSCTAVLPVIRNLCCVQENSRLSNFWPLARNSLMSGHYKSNLLTSQCWHHWGGEDVFEDDCSDLFFKTLLKSAIFTELRLLTRMLKNSLDHNFAVTGSVIDTECSQSHVRSKTIPTQFYTLVCWRTQRLCFNPSFTADHHLIIHIDWVSLHGSKENSTRTYQTTKILILM